jgi:uncharacterized protein YdeI (YjbR/CyaY-like superfamily)
MASAGMSQSALPTVGFKNQGAWQSWLVKNCKISTGIWVRIAKKSSGLESVSYPEALEVALCFGWIDGQKKPLDESSWLQRFGPRGPRSIWSKINRSKAEELIRQGRMQETGLLAIENAKENGKWENAYESQKTAIPAKDFERALKGNLKAKAFYETLNRQNKYAILFRLHNVKKQETREKRIEKFIEMLERHEKLYP